MMPKKKTIAPPATPTSEPEPVEAEVIVPEPAQPKPQLTPEQRLELIEMQLKQADNNFQQIGAFLTKMEPLVQLSEKLAEQQQAAASNPQAQPTQGLGGSVGAILPFVQQIMGASGGNNALADKIMEKVVETGLDSMFAGQRFLAAVQNKMLSNMGADIVNEALPRARSQTP